MVGESFAQAGEDPGLLDVVEIGVQVNGVPWSVSFQVRFRLLERRRGSSRRLVGDSEALHCFRVITHVGVRAMARAPAKGDA